MNGFGRHHQPTQGCSECDAFEASVLLRDSPEDRERLRLILIANGYVVESFDLDAIVAALRGER